METGGKLPVLRKSGGASVFPPPGEGSPAGFPVFPGFPAESPRRRRGRKQSGAAGIPGISSTLGIPSSQAPFFRARGGFCCRHGARLSGSFPALYSSYLLCPVHVHVHPIASFSANPPAPIRAVRAFRVLRALRALTPLRRQYRPHRAPDRSCRPRQSCRPPSPCRRNCCNWETFR